VRKVGDTSGENWTAVPAPTLGFPIDTFHRGRLLSPAWKLLTFSATAQILASATSSVWHVTLLSMVRC
jgi:hypothetical protein